MTTAQKGYKYIGKLTLTFLPLILVVLILSFVDSALYTEVPLFIQYIIGTLDGNDKGNLPAFIQKIFDLGGTPLKMVIYASIGLMVFQTFRGLLKFLLTGISRNNLAQAVSYKMRRSLYEHIQSLSYSYHSNADLGDLIQRCTSDVDAVQNFISVDIPSVLGVFGVLISSLIKMFAISVELSLISLIIIPVAFISSVIYFKFIEKAYERAEEMEAELMTIMQENLASVRVVKAFANEKYEIDKFDEKNHAYRDKCLHLQKISSFFWGFSDFTSYGQMALTMIYAIMMVKSGRADLSLSAIITVITLIGTYIWPVRSLGRMIGNVGKSAVSAGRIAEILNIPSEYEIDGTEEPKIEGKIEFKNVYFKFDDTDKYLLKEVNFEINKGETVVLIGKTGCGKSTVAKLLTRMNDCEKGEILIDGVNIKDIKKTYIRSNIGLILQDPFLFSKSVYDNIAIVNPLVTKEKVYKTARLASIEKDINGFEKGYETIVGEKGATLSGGQKQRIAIARMLIEDKPIIIFDDSLSALDSETDLSIRTALASHEPKATSIIITHRITAAKTADKVIVLDDGKISQIGTHETLKDVDGLYKKLWNIQADLENEFLKVLNGEVK